MKILRLLVLFMFLTVSSYGCSDLGIPTTYAIYEYNIFITVVRTGDIQYKIFLHDTPDDYMNGCSFIANYCPPDCSPDFKLIYPEPDLEPNKVIILYKKEGEISDIHTSTSYEITDIVFRECYVSEIEDYYDWVGACTHKYNGILIEPKPNMKGFWIYYGSAEIVATKISR